MENVVKLKNYCGPEGRKYLLAEYIDSYNNHRYHESLNHVTPADVHFGRDKQILRNRMLLKPKSTKRKEELALFEFSESMT